MAFQIPEDSREQVAELFALKTDELDALHAALVGATPHLIPWALYREIRDKVPIERRALRDVVQLLLTFALLGEEGGLEPSSFADQLQIAAEAWDKTKVPVVGWEDFKRRMTAILSLHRTLGVTAKSAHVASYFPRHVRGSRILTDARPVFSRAVSDGPAAFLISHTLQVDFLEDGVERSWSATMNGTDLEQLRVTIIRAMEKQMSLSKSLAKTGAPILKEIE